MRLTLCVQTLEQEEKDNEAVSKMMALDQKNQLLNLFNEKNRPTLNKWPEVNSPPASGSNVATTYTYIQTYVRPKRPLTPLVLSRIQTYFTSSPCFLWMSGENSSGMFVFKKQL